MFAKTATVGRSNPGLMLPHAGLRAATLGAVQAMVERSRWAIWRWYQIRRTSRQVSRLSDHLLGDIGLARVDLARATVRRVREEEALRRGGAW
jgi:uncharacterized protein YjiS (DUF1127 family)